MKAYHVTAAGVAEIEAPADMVEKAISQQVDERLQEQHASAARQRLLKLQKTPAPPDRIVLFEVGGDTWYLLKLDFAGIMRLGLMTPRNEKGELDLNEVDNLRALTAATLFCCCVNGPDDDTPFFTHFEAWEWAHNIASDVVQVVNDLFSQCLAMNPMILPEAYEYGKNAPSDKDELEKKDSSDETAASESATSSIPQTTTPLNGSMSTVSSDEPATSPHDSESSPSTVEATSA